LDRAAVEGDPAGAVDDDGVGAVAPWMVRPRSVTSCAPRTVIVGAVLPVGRRTAPPSNTIGASAVPDRVMVTVSSCVPVMLTTWPGSTTSAAACTVQNGVAALPSPASVHAAMSRTYNVVAAACATGTDTTPARTANAVAAAMFGRRT
jgi:hypothetical protein